MPWVQLISHADCAIYGMNEPFKLDYELIRSIYMDRFNGNVKDDPTI
jgi:hypothetical protein